MNLEVVLPTTTAGVRDLLSGMIYALNKDAERAIKARKGDRTYPGIQDKLDAAHILTEAREKIVVNSKSRWKKFQNPEPTE